MNTAIFEDKNFQVEDEGMYELINILLGHITKTVPEIPKTAHDVDDTMVHSIATALTLVYVLLLQSDMEQRSQLAEYIAKVPNLFNCISSLLKVIIFHKGRCQLEFDFFTILLLVCESFCSRDFIGSRGYPKNADVALPVRMDKVQSTRVCASWKNEHHSSAKCHCWWH